MAGEPVLGAAAHLSVGALEGTIDALLEGGLPELAIAIARCHLYPLPPSLDRLPCYTYTDSIARCYLYPLPPRARGILEARVRELGGDAAMLDDCVAELDRNLSSGSGGHK